ncbi:MAG: cytochrome c biogenesis protein CcsA [Microscillaceae bacterium]|nr:cytochrome c biogenesis protein CcsA [Microscillaceae bacterium]
MINTYIGNIGHLLVIISFVMALVATTSYWVATRYQNTANTALYQSWRRFARGAFVVHALAVVGVVVCLFDIIYNHRYEYHYAWDHSSNNLPTQYMIACFWEGQEGSFLLWVFWHVCLGAILIMTNRYWETSIMTILMAVQTFLASMILGIVIVNVKIGSDPFILLRDAMPNLPIFQSNPNFIPEDGSGLNALLQNYWMVIHPPTLFLGFALTIVPFVYCIAGLWQRKYRDWVRPALPWALVGGAILGLGILMGGYWAYETLNFGGYWNWDPVENAVYVPWLVLVGAIHTMIAFKKNSTALKAAIILTISTFLLILYSTFLTRSGILGNASVHSFTDLGLSGQLLLYLLAFVALSIVLMVARWREIPSSEQELSVYSREFWIFMGATVLCLAGFQVILTTSIPVYNKIVELLGFVSNLALPADQVAHYTKFQLWGAVLIAILSGTGQFFWWQKMDKASVQKALTPPLILTFLFSAIIIALSQVSNLSFIVLLTASVYTITANSIILLSLLRKSTFKLSGGAVAHIGIGMMLLGILFSSGYSKVVSKNQTGRLFNKEWSAEDNENNLLLWLNQATKMQEYQVTYKGDYVEAQNFPHFIKKTDLMPTQDPFKAIAANEIKYNAKTYFKVGDTLKLYPENTYFRVDYRNAQGQVYTLYPRAQINEQMGGLIASPDILRQLSKDLYTHVSSIPDPRKEREWSKTQEFVVALQDTFFLNDYIAVFDGQERVSSEEIMRLTSTKTPSNEDIGLKAVVRILGKEGKEHRLYPIFLIKDKQVGIIPDVSLEHGLRISLQKIDPETGKFTFGINTTQRDYIIMKAMEKPLINVLWIGTLVVMLGFGIAVLRRYTEFVKMRDKGME